MTFYQSYNDFLKESHQLNELTKHSIQNRVFSIYNQAIILEFFHEQKGLWYCFFDLQSQYSKLLVTFDDRFQLIVQKWAQLLDLSTKQQRCTVVEIHDTFPKLRMQFTNDNGSLTYFIYSGHPIRPYVHIKKENSILLSMGHAIEESLTWKQISTQSIPLWHDRMLHDETIWPIIFNRIAFPYTQKLNLALQQKIKKNSNFDKDQVQHEMHHVYVSFATYLLTLNKDEVNKDSLEFEGHKLPVYRHLSSGKNASIYFKKAKKASHGLIEVEKQRMKNKEDILNLEKNIHLMKNYSLKDLERVKEFLVNIRLIGSQQKIRKTVETIPKNRPYFIVKDNQKFSFGKNELQNDVVTFQIASKKDFFFHIANQSGSHVILHHPNPSHELILLAGKLVLSLANVKDGEVTYTPVKYLRKTKKIGLVKLEKNQVIKIKIGNDDLTDWIQTAKRY